MRFFFLMVLVLFTSLVQGQNPNLANSYFRNGEYEKAAELYEQLVEKSNYSPNYNFQRYLQCLIFLQDYDKAEDRVRKAMKASKNDPPLHIYLGNIHERQGEKNKAEKEYEKAIDLITSSPATVSSVAGTFQSYRMTEWAIRAYLRGQEVLKDDAFYAYRLAELYRSTGDQSRMIEYYLKSLQSQNTNVESIKNILSRTLSREDLDDLVQQLYIQIQDFPDDLTYLELLQWVFIQKKDYANALRQSRALDKRTNNQGAAVLKLGDVAANAGDYDAAVTAYDYVINDLGASSPYFFQAQMSLLRARRDKVVKGRRYDEGELKELEGEYESFIERWGKTPQTAEILSHWAHLETIYLGNTRKGIDILSDLIALPNVDREVYNRAKLDLGDAYLIEGEVWDASLLYSQVDKEYREDYLGEVARYKNAKLYYYIGDFEWAQAQFDILKAATSRLISNDAIDQSVFIMDNLGLDTTPIPLQMYARAELLQFQNQYDKAFAVLDSIAERYPNHGLLDDIWYLKAKVYTKQKNYDRARFFYERVYNEYPDDIRADNAIYELAQLYDYQLDEPEKAKALYEKLFIDFSGSVLAVEARKRFRILRGDQIQ